MISAWTTADEWASIGLHIERVAEGVARVRRAEVRERLSAEVARLRLDYEKADGFREGVRAMASEAPPHCSERLLRARADLLARAREIWCECWNTPNGRGRARERDHWQDLEIAILAATALRSGEASQTRAAIRAAMATRQLQRPAVLSNDESYFKRIERIMKESREGIGRLLDQWGIAANSDK